MFSVKQFLAQKLITDMEHPPYSPELAVSKNKVFLKGTKISRYCRHPKKCDDSNESYSTTGISKCFQQWQHHWAKCTATQVDE
jgi:hypothetical protein